jgi:hypothetical protein
MMSGERAIGQGTHGFEEVARGLPAIGPGDMKLEVRLGSAHRQPSHREPSLLGQGHQRVGLREFCSALMMDDDATGGYGLAHQPLRRHAWQRIATGPACGIERFEFGSGGFVQLAGR